jgi:hypothetical protein
MASGKATVGSGSALLIVPANTQRLSLIIFNNGSSFIYLGGDSSITTNTGLPLDALNSYYEDSGGQRTYLGDYYAISENSTNDVRYWERVR